MSRISKYQDTIIKFFKTKNLFNDMGTESKKILFELIETINHNPAILCLTILNNQCKKYDIKIHGYYLASGIDLLSLIANISCNRYYYESIYNRHTIDNLIIDLVSCFYKCIIQNIDTLRMSKNRNINFKITQICIEYSAKMIPRIIHKTNFISNKKMKKTDLFCRDFDEKSYTFYKNKKKIDKLVILDEIQNRYGTVCQLAMCLGWILGQGDESNIMKIKNIDTDKYIGKIESLGLKLGTILKIHDDFKNIDRDMDACPYTLNYVLNFGIKDSYMELIDTKSDFVEGMMYLGINTKTSKEILDIVTNNINDIVKNISVDMETSYDDVSVN